jgi:probable addiction module antidote protein
LASTYLDAVFADGDQEVFLLALRDLAEAKGMAALAKKAKLNRERLYRILPDKGSPRLSSLTAILGSAGLCLSVRRSRSVSA